MRLLHCIISVNPKGGGPMEVVRQQMAAMTAAGHYSAVVCLDSPDAPWLKGYAAELTALGPALGAYGYSPRLKKWLEAEAPRFDAVIVHGLWRYHGFATWRALHGTRLPYFVFPHGMLDPWFKRTYPLKHLKKWLYWPWADYRVLRDARAVFFTADDEKLLARESFWLYRCHERVVTIGTAGPAGTVDEDRVAFLNRFPALAGKKILLFFGRLHEKKGIDLLLRAWAQAGGPAGGKTNDSRQLVIAGPGEPALVERMHALSRRLSGEDQVLFTGMLAGPLKWGALAAADAFILPSHQENFGMAVTEALACGTPVLLSTRVNIWREIVADGAGCAEADTLEGTERLLRTWLDEPAERWRAKRQSARACFETRFTIARSAESLVREISACLR